MAKNVVEYPDDLYDEYDPETAEDEQDALDERDDEDSIYDALKTGKNPRRVLPPPKGSRWGPKGKPSPIHTTHEHFVEGKLLGMKRGFGHVCPRKMLPADPPEDFKGTKRDWAKKRWCPTCDYALSFRKRRNQADRDIGWEVLPKQQRRIVVINREKESLGGRVLRVGKKLYEGMLDKIEEQGDFTHPAKGYDLIFRKKKTGESKRDVEYRVIMGEERPLSEDVEQGIEWLEDRPDLEQFETLPTVEELEDIAEMLEDAFGDPADPRRSSRRRDRDDDDGDRSSRGRRRSRRTRDGDDDDDGDKKPRRGRRASEDAADGGKDDKD